jgi:integrase
MTPPTDSVLVKEMKKAVERETPTPTPGMKPLTFPMLRAIVSKAEETTEDIRNVCLILLMTFGMLRESEAVNLKKEDVWEERVETTNMLMIFLRHSKTDQCNDGYTISIAPAPKGEVCPLKWFRKFSSVRNESSPFFFHQLGPKITQPLATTTPNHVIKRLLKSIGIESSGYGSHSCRKGGCTLAVEAGVDMRLVAEHGRWKSSSILSYIKDSVDTKLSVTRSMYEKKKKKKKKK